MGKIFALACTRAGADIVIHHGHSDTEAVEVRNEIMGLGRQAWIFKADLNDPEQARIFLLSSPEYITGEIIHLDGGRHLV